MKVYYLLKNVQTLIYMILNLHDFYTVRIIYTQKLKFLKYYVIHTLDFKKLTTIQFSFKRGVY